MRETTDAEIEGAAEPRFKPHKYLSYQGYAFPWYATLIWISFFIGGLIYFVRNVLLTD